MVKVWFYFISSVLFPSKHLDTVRRNEAILLYALLEGYKINVGKIIENSFLSYSRRKCRGLIPYPATITSLYLLGGVDEEWGKEETYHRASLQTFIGVIKGPKNRGKEKEIEMEEERGKERCNEPVQWESPPQKQQEFQGSLSPNWNVSPNLREIHQEQAESSRHQGNNIELMEMLKSMKQEMKERDNQLKIQLQLRDEYLDAELRRRDQNIEDALKQRNEEWRAELEKRDT